MMSATVYTDLGKGSRITGNGEIKGKKYEDKGGILEIEPQKKLKYSRFSPLSEEKEAPENYHIVSINLTGDEKQTKISLSQDKNSTERANVESSKNWKMMLDGLKKTLKK